MTCQLFENRPLDLCETRKAETERRRLEQTEALLLLNEAVHQLSKMFPPMLWRNGKSYVRLGMA